MLVSMPLLVLVAQLTSILQARGSESYIAKTSTIFAVVLVALMGALGTLFGPLAFAIGVGVAFVARSGQLFVKVIRTPHSAS